MTGAVDQDGEILLKPQKPRLSPIQLKTIQVKRRVGLTLRTVHVGSETRITIANEFWWMLS